MLHHEAHYDITRGTKPGLYLRSAWNIKNRGHNKERDVLKKISEPLWNAYRGWDVPSRVRRLGGWLERRRQDESGGGYDHSETVNEYYDLCNEFMQFGWNESLHFAPLRPDESLAQSIVRHQRLMIEKLQLREDMRVIDVGCGVGGPMRSVARETGCKVLCLNNNEQQLETARKRNSEQGLDHLAEYMRCNFMDMSAIEADSFDAAYAIESTCHAPDKQGAFEQIYRVLKPGALFWGQEMCMTDKYDPANARDREVKDELMLGIALDGIATYSEVNRMLEAAGFDIVEAVDRGIADESGTPWYRPMEGLEGTLQSRFRGTPLGRKAMIAGLRVGEACRFVPKGSTAVVQLMNRTADAYVAGGKSGIFSPLYCFLVRKPM
ncbi:MAG: methyltransferase domain-containing protein [Gammaproteobacteria bacterium]|nr:methyltransferase domain-containing protein [Gammaproteobacteria bacterium]MYF00811.1 methyltransferase domain-containing protein [Gammaproteobacteria bacterium]MYG95838.1 methyltransferase domain-containing protein [Gammaproteobacteria bacterium]